MEHDRNKASELREVEVHFFSGLAFVVKLCCGEKNYKNFEYKWSSDSKYAF